LHPFDYPTEVFGNLLGCCHSMELHFAFATHA
jgi:hypothetical protein